MEKKRSVRTIILGIIICLVATLLFPFSVYAAKVYLKSGDVFEGEIIEKTDEYIKIKMGEIELPILTNKIDNIDGLKIKQDITEKEYITEEEVRVFLKNLETIGMDVDAYSQTLADDCKFVTIIGNNKSEISREEMIKSFESMRELYREHDSKYKIINLDIAGNKAVVQVRVIERVTFLSGETKYFESDPELTLEKVDGKVKEKLTKWITSEEKIIDLFRFLPEEKQDEIIEEAVDEAVDRLKDKAKELE